MVHHLKTSHVGAAHQYALQKEYNNFHDGDTYEEIEMEAALVRTMCGSRTGGWSLPCVMRD
jgi:hypothetical protein